MQLYAMSTGSPITGALTMGVFALGLLRDFGSRIDVNRQRIFARLFFKGAGVVVAMLAIFNISNGINLLGIFPSVLGSETSDPAVKIVNGFQEIYMKQNSNGYIPNNFTITQGIPVRWIITSENINTCASSIISSKLGIRQGLRKGQNIIEFTPTEVGTVRFSCTMGMYNGTFNVVENKNMLNKFNSLGLLVVLAKIM